MRPPQQLLAIMATAPCVVTQTPQPSGSGSFRAPTTAIAGGTVQVEVASTASTIFVDNGSGDITCIEVPANKTVTIPVPETPGAVITVTVGRGRMRDTLQITITSP